MGIDRIDSRILVELQNDGRLSNKELAVRIGLAPSSSLERVRRLLSVGVLKGFHAEVEPGALGVSLQAMVSVRLRRHSRPLVEQFRAHIMGMPEVRDFFHLAGSSDFLVHVMVRDADHLRDLVLNAFTDREEVAHVETSVIFEHQRNPCVPHLSATD